MILFCGRSMKFFHHYEIPILKENVVSNHIIFAQYPQKEFFLGVMVHKGITIVLSLFKSHWLAVVYCLVFCIGSCEPVHKDRTCT